MPRKLTPTQTKLIASTFVTTRVYMSGSGQMNAARNLYAKRFVSNWYPIERDDVTPAGRRAFFDDNGRTFWINDQTNSFLIFHDYQLYAMSRNADFAKQIVEALKALPERPGHAARTIRSDHLPA